MPLSRLAKTRETLTEGYQYGDMSRAVQRHNALEDQRYASLRPVDLTEGRGYGRFVQAYHGTRRLGLRTVSREEYEALGGVIRRFDEAQGRVNP